MDNKSYDSSHIKVLDELTHIRTNPGMYVGDCATPTHLLEEALDNGLDECFGRHASIVAVGIDTKKHIYCVMDNGRGIPYDNDVPITISTKLFSGAKFKGSKSAYGVAVGLHGVGLVAVNALSKEFSIDIYRDKHASFVFEDCILKEKKVESISGPKPFSTKIQFVPDKKFFQTLKIDIERIRKRLLIASVELPNVHFVLMVDDSKEVIKLDKDKFFKEMCLSDNDTEKSKVYNFLNKEGSEEFNAMFCYSFSGTTAPKMYSSVNLLPVDNGGTHLNIFAEILREYFTTKAKKTNLKFQPSDCLCGLRAISV